MGTMMTLDPEKPSEKILRWMSRPANANLLNIEFRPVETVAEFESALKLVESKTRSRSALTLRHLLPNSVVFIARHEVLGIVATMTLIEDSALKLSLEASYSTEINALRYEGRSLAEIAMIAFDRDIASRMGQSDPKLMEFGIMCRLLKSVIDFVRAATQTDTLLIDELSNDHGFIELLRLEKLNAAPDRNARYLDLNKAFWTGEGSGFHQLFLAAVPNKLRFDRRLKFQRSDIERLFFKESDVLKSANARERRIVFSQYPQDFNLQSMFFEKKTADREIPKKDDF